VTSGVWPLLRGVGAAVLTVAWAIAAHVSSSSGQPSAWGAMLALAPLLVAAALGLWRLPRRWLAALLGAGLAGVLVVSWPLLTARVALLYFVQHMGIYLLLASFFGRTLSGGGESLVTQMARRIHGGVLSTAQQRYTRKVTVAWTVFFVLMALTSAVLFAGAPLPAGGAFDRPDVRGRVAGPASGATGRRPRLPHGDGAGLAPAQRQRQTLNPAWPGAA
jgi:uncharacterized membrane protein